MSFFPSGGYDIRRKIESWQSLVHVCRRWRGLVFGSLCRLNLQLYCVPTSARKSLDFWPALPLLIQGHVSEPIVDNIVAELEHSDRICQIYLNCHTTSRIEKLWTAINAGVIPGAQNSVPVIWKLVVRASSSRFILGWIRATSTTPLPGCHSISRIAKTPFFCHSPQLSLARKHSSFRVHFTRGDGRLPLHVDQPQYTST
jgi:hypothetical protein